MNPEPDKIQYVRIVTAEYDCGQCSAVHSYVTDDTMYYAHQDNRGDKRWIVEVVDGP